MSTKLLARFTVNVGGQPRSLFSVRRRSVKEGIVLGLTSPFFDSFDRDESRILGQKYSIHPSLDSEEGITAIKHTRKVEGKSPWTTEHYTKVIKNGKNFAVIFCRRCGYLSDPALIPTTRSGVEISLGDQEPQSFTLIYAVVVSALDNKFVVPQNVRYLPINAVGLDCEYFRLTVLWTFMSIPSHPSFWTGHQLTVPPTTEAQAKLMLGQPPEDIMENFIAEFLKLKEELLERHKLDKDVETIEFYRSYCAAFASGVFNSPKYLEHALNWQIQTVLNQTFLDMTKKQ